MADVTETQLAQQYQPGTDLGDALRQDDKLLNAQNHPILPASQPTEEAAPEMGDFRSKLTTAMETLANMRAQNPTPPQPGEWARQIVGAVPSAISKSGKPGAARFVGALGQLAGGVAHD